MARALVLSPHPSPPTPPAIAIEATARRENARLLLRYVVTGAIETLLVPGAAPPARADGLWRRTCFECFVKAGPGAGYCELNFSPSSEWAAYAFAGYREGMAPHALAAPPRIKTESARRRFVLTAEVEPAPAASSLRLGLAAVIETRAGDTTYWALVHPSERPDFHHPDCFTVELGETPRP